MAPPLKVDKISPPPARLSAFLYHTPHVLFSLLLFLAVTLFLVYGSFHTLGVSANSVDFTIVAFMSFSIPVILISYLVSNISWLWDGRYPIRYGLQAGATGSVIMLITILIGFYFEETSKGLAFGLGCMGGLWYLTLRTHGSAPARIAFPLSLLSPITSLYYLWDGGLTEDFTFGLLAIFALSFASHFFLFLVDSPYKKAIGVSGTKHMSAFIEHFSTGDGRRLTKAIREICQTIETKNSWTSIRKEGKTVAFLAVPGVHPGPVGTLGGSNLPSKIDSVLPGLGFAFHGSSTNDHNPLRDEDLTRIAKAMVSASESAVYSDISNPTIKQGDVPAAYVTGIGNGTLIFAKPGDSDDILPELAARLERSSSSKTGKRIMIDLHNQEGWGRPPLAAGTKEGTSLEISASKALRLSSSSPKGKLRVGISHIPGEDLSRGIGPGGIRVLVIENDFSDESNQRTAVMLWDANGLGPGMNDELQEGLSGSVDELLLATTDNHYVNVKPGGFNPLIDSEGILPIAKQALEEAIDDISPAESSMGTVYVDGVEILGQGKQDKISAAANSIIEVARYSWLPIYSSATMFCIMMAPYL
jgi:putative membrane protein